MMKNRERFQKLMNFEPVDRLPMFEWAGWWDKTLARWYSEGLSQELGGEAARAHFGHDAHRQFWVSTRRPGCPGPKGHGLPIITDRADYLEIKKFLYPDRAVDQEALAAWAEAHRRGELILWFTLDGFFWFPRGLFGIEPHLYAFYDCPDLMKEINEDLLAFQLRTVEQIFEVLVPDFMTFAEDMSYNHGPMISEEQFDEFMAPYYRRITPILLERGCMPVVDSDGDISEVIGWFMREGVQGFLPLERQAGVDVSAIRERYPDVRIIGAFDKTVMHRGEARVREEFERLLPVMRQGGFIPSVDHQTPPEVSLEQYWSWNRLLKEYCEKATRALDNPAIGR